MWKSNEERHQVCWNRMRTRDNKTKTPAKSAAERQRAYRERKRAMANNTYILDSNLQLSAQLDTIGKLKNYSESLKCDLSTCPINTQAVKFELNTEPNHNQNTYTRDPNHSLSIQLNTMYEADNYPKSLKPEDSINPVYAQVVRLLPNPESKRKPKANVSVPTHLPLSSQLDTMTEAGNVTAMEHSGLMESNNPPIISVNSQVTKSESSTEFPSNSTIVIKMPMSNAERQRKYREKKHARVNKTKIPIKSPAERQREYRARKKILGAERQRKYRERKRVMLNMKKTPPKSGAERQREYRERKRARTINAYSLVPNFPVSLQPETTDYVENYPGPSNENDPSTSSLYTQVIKLEPDLESIHNRNEYTLKPNIPLSSQQDTVKETNNYPVSLEANNPSINSLYTQVIKCEPNLESLHKYNNYTLEPNLQLPTHKETSYKVENHPGPTKVNDPPASSLYTQVVKLEPDIGSTHNHNTYILKPNIPLFTQPDIVGGAKYYSEPLKANNLLASSLYTQVIKLEPNSEFIHDQNTCTLKPTNPLAVQSEILDEAKNCSKPLKVDNSLVSSIYAQAIMSEPNLEFITSHSTNKIKVPKSDAQRQREYRERKRARENKMKKMPKSDAQRQREYRERKRARANKTKVPAKSPAERQRECRNRKKLFGAERQQAYRDRRARANNSHFFYPNLLSSAQSDNIIEADNYPSHLKVNNSSINTLLNAQVLKIEQNSESTHDCNAYILDPKLPLTSQLDTTEETKNYPEPSKTKDSLTCSVYTQNVMSNTTSVLSKPHNVIFKTPNSDAVGLREYQERKHAKTKTPAKSPAERQREYRARKKSLLNSNANLTKSISEKSQCLGLPLIISHSRNAEQNHILDPNLLLSAQLDKSESYPGPSTTNDPLISSMDVQVNKSKPKSQSNSPYGGYQGNKSKSAYNNLQKAIQHNSFNHMSTVDDRPWLNDDLKTLTAENEEILEQYFQTSIWKI